MKFFVFLVALLVSTIGASAEDVDRRSEVDAVKRISAGDIILCSDLAELGVSDIVSFSKTVTPNQGSRNFMQGIDFIDKKSNSSTNQSKNPTNYFFAGKRQLSDKAKTCLESFPIPSHALLETISDVANDLGEVPEFLKRRGGDSLYGPTRSVVESIKGPDWSVIIYLTQFDGSDSADEALTAFFGLLPDYCQSTGNCSSSDRNRANSNL